jgi:hypothetical protein
LLSGTLGNVRIDDRNMFSQALNEEDLLKVFTLGKLSARSDG